MKAFPHTYDKIIDGHVATNTNYGMDLRDWFAGQALTGLLANTETKLNSNIIVAAAYRLANEMMEQRENKHE